LLAGVVVAKMGGVTRIDSVSVGHNVPPCRI
jgi:hypothetical protein